MASSGTSSWRALAREPCDFRRGLRTWLQGRLVRRAGTAVPRDRHGFSDAAAHAARTYAALENLFSFKATSRTRAWVRERQLRELRSSHHAYREPERTFAELAHITSRAVS